MDVNQEINIEQDFWNDFILEAFEHLEEIESNVITLEQNPEDMDIIHTMFRAFHTIKGLSGFVEHTIIQEIAHKTETLMDYCRKGELSVSTDIVDAILKSADYIRRLCEDVESYKDTAFIAQIINNIEKLEALANVETEKQTTEEPQIEEQIQAETTAMKTESENEEHVQPINEHVEISACDLEPTVNFEKEEIKTDVTPEEIIPFELETIKNQEEQPENSDEKVTEIESQPIESFEDPEQAIQQEQTEFEEFTEAVHQTQLEPTIEPVSIKPQEHIQSKPEATFTQEESPKPETFQPELPAKKAAANEEYMKVANNKIDHLVDTIGELIINQSLIDQYIASNYSHDNTLITNMAGFFENNKRTPKFINGSKIGIIEIHFPKNQPYCQRHNSRAQQRR